MCPHIDTHASTHVCTNTPNTNIYIHTQRSMNNLLWLFVLTCTFKYRTLNLSFLSYFLQIIMSGTYKTIIIATVMKTGRFSIILAPKSSNTVLKSIVFGGTKSPAPKLPNKLLLKVTVS